MFLQNSNLRKKILVLLDIILILLAIVFSISIYSENFSTEGLLEFKWLLIVTPTLGFFVYYFSGQYKSITRYIGRRDLYKICARNVIICIFTFLIGIFFNQPIPSFQHIILVWILFNAFVIPPKFLLRDLIFLLRDKSKKGKRKVVIYGAGSAGSQLADSINYQGDSEIIAFLDDDISLKNRTIKGIKIISPKEIKNIKEKIDFILLAIPSLSTIRYKTILKELYSYEFNILRVPSLEDLTSGRAKIDTLKPISIEDLLSRQHVSPKEYLLGKNIVGEVICITGAAGSIGSELSKQLLKLNPKKLLLIDQNENGLYNLEQKLNKLNSSKVNVDYALCNCTNKHFIENILQKKKVDILLHAAAYKHVPLVEFNPMQGIVNNVFSTKVLCEAAKKSHIKQMILVSSDKAVRPTNVMGVTKRLSELIIQAYASKEELNKEINNKKTLFSMVRFGNVLNSSGSVVPLFKKQIAEGGPITLTHEKVERYFMTINEAVELLLQTVSMAEGGDVFLLDMGKPVLIKNLAKQMIKLSGQTIKDSENPEGDIEIICTGLRSGEKLYEELLIDAKSIKTSHPLIFKANENFIESEILFDLLRKLHKKININDIEGAFILLKEIVPEWNQF